MLKTNDAVIIDCARTAMGRSKNGVFRNVRAETLSASLLDGLLARNPNIDLAKVDDVIWGCVNQTLEQGLNIGRMVSLISNLPDEIPGQTINRLCGSSMSALHIAAQAIQSNNGHLYIVGGVEHIGHVPMAHGMDMSPALGKKAAKACMMLGMTADILAKEYNVSRQAQDELGERSHRLAYQATVDGKFANEIISVQGHDNLGVPTLISTDETIRPETNLEDLAKLGPVFDPINGTTTAGTSSQFSDGASAMIVMSSKMAKDMGLTPLAKIRSMSVKGVTASKMGFGPVPASINALEKASLVMSDIDHIEINEAFASQSLACLSALDLTNEIDSKVNIHGGAIALGHPFGCSGTRITTTLLNSMIDTDSQFGLSTMCIGMGQGIATVIERL